MAAIAPFERNSPFSPFLFDNLWYHGPRMPKKPVDKSFGKHLTLLRKQRGLTMKELAKRLGVTLRTVYYYERMSTLPPSHLIYKLAKELNVSADEILGIKTTKITIDPRDAALWRNFQRTKTLPKHDQQTMVRLLNALLAKNQKRKR